MRVCTAAQMGLIDRDTIDGGTAGEILMERAGRAMTEVLLGALDDLVAPGHDDGCGCTHGGETAEVAPVIAVICGKGNNGGDGLVMARLLNEVGLTVRVMLLCPESDLSPDARLNFDRLPDGIDVDQPDREAWAEAAAVLLAEADLLVDAIFGTGIKPPLRGAYVELIGAINDAGVPCLAVDIPSGVAGDDGRVSPDAVAADLTVTVGLPKRGLLLAPGRDFCGEIEVVDIGFPAETCHRYAPDHHWLPREDYLALLPPRPSDVHKYRCGTALLVAGSKAYGGAAHLAGLGALRSGAGLITVAAPVCLETALRVGLPEALIAPLAMTESGTLAPPAQPVWQDLLQKKTAVAVGPGLGADPATDAWLTSALAELDRPVVIDADGLGAYARNGAVPAFTHDQVILTPHAGELAALLGTTSAEVIDRQLELVPELAQRWNVVLMLKGSPSLIAAPDGRLFFNASGDDALARGGSGDVLTGLLAGLLAQGCDALAAALLGAYVHGLAGTLAAEGRSTRSVLVREIADGIGPVFEAMEREASSDATLRRRIWGAE